MFNWIAEWWETLMILRDKELMRNLQEAKTGETIGLADIRLAEKYFDDDDNFCDDCLTINHKEVEATRKWHNWQLCNSHYLSNLQGEINDCS